MEPERIASHGERRIKSCTPPRLHPAELRRACATDRGIRSSVPACSRASRGSTDTLSRFCGRKPMSMFAADSRLRRKSPSLKAESPTLQSARPSADYAELQRRPGRASASSPLSALPISGRAAAHAGADSQQQSAKDAQSKGEDQHTPIDANAHVDRNRYGQLNGGKCLRGP